MSTGELLDIALGLESAVWDALVAGDRSADEALLADGFVGLYPTGFADRAEHAAQLADGPTVVDYSIETPIVLELSGDSFLLCYDARYRRPGHDDHDRMYVSSLWQRQDRGWRNLFSQDTPAGTAPAGPGR